MTVRLVVYAEGSGEATGEITLLPAPGEPLLRKSLGAAHLLVERLVCETTQIPLGAIVFEAPRNLRGRQARGGDFLNPTSLRQLLTWFPGSERPTLAIVLVDQDGDVRREANLTASTNDLPASHLIQVAVREFESWLISDIASVSRLLGVSFADPGPPEGLEPRQAKDLLQTAISGTSRADQAKQLRMEIASNCELREVRRRCPAFAEFSARIARALAPPT